MDFPVYSVYGTLQFPVHAKNLDKTMELIYKFHKNPFIIAIDSCLGYEDHVGYIFSSALCPGRGVSKHHFLLVSISITGIVDRFSESSHETIQTTRLQTVFYLASFIAKEFRFLNFKFHIPLFDVSPFLLIASEIK